jgi:exodeoxyribonuclease-3
VAILSRHPLTDVVRNNPHYPDEQQRLIAATVQGVRIICAYVVNGQAVGSDKYAYKMAWLAALRLGEGRDGGASGIRDPGRLQHRAGRPRRPRPGGMGRPDPLLGAGTRRPARLFGLGLADAFRLFEQPEKLYSWWDYRMMAFRRNRGLRIDHILLSPSLRKALHRLRHRPRAAQVGAAVRSHVPVIATID